VLGYLVVLGLGMVLGLGLGLVLVFLVVPGLLLVATLDGVGSRLMPSGIAGTRRDTARRARRRCRWLTAGRG